MDVDISVSLELLILIDWLITNEKRALDNIVKSALKNGLLQKLNHDGNRSDSDLVEQFYPTILNFLVTLEKNLIECLHKEQNQAINPTEFLPALNKISLKDINLKTIYLSTNQASEKLKRTKNKPAAESIQKTIFAQILKNWKPTKNDLPN